MLVQLPALAQSGVLSGASSKPTEYHGATGRVARRRGQSLRKVSIGACSRSSVNLLEGADTYLEGHAWGDGDGRECLQAIECQVKSRREAARAREQGLV